VAGVVQRYLHLTEEVEIEEPPVPVDADNISSPEITMLCSKVGASASVQKIREKVQVRRSKSKVSEPGQGTRRF
jgi:hypothetical protein